MKEAVTSSDISVNIDHITLRNIPEDKTSSEEACLAYVLGITKVFHFRHQPWNSLLRCDSCIQRVFSLATNTAVFRLYSSLYMANRKRNTEEENSLQGKYM
jgi:hypothetical protein